MTKALTVKLDKFICKLLQGINPLQDFDEFFEISCWVACCTDACLHSLHQLAGFVIVCEAHCLDNAIGRQR